MLCVTTLCKGQLSAATSLTQDICHQHQNLMVHYGPDEAETWCRMHSESKTALLNMTQVRFMLVQSWRSTGLGYRVRLGVEIELGWGLKWDWDRGRSLNLGLGMARKEHMDIS